eukprot:jgi/Chlat1/3873/Chrsp26S04167
MGGLPVWLVVVGLLRLLAVVLGILKPETVRQQVFPNTPVTGTHARTFSAWTFTTCMLCMLCASDMHSRTIYLATLLSFVIALVHLGSEFAVFKTMSASTFASPGIVASVSILWMLKEQNTYLQSAK